MNYSKVLSTIVTLTAFAAGATAQQLQQAPHPLEYAFDNQEIRTEIFLPQIDGKNFYKADLHLHTIYSEDHPSLSMELK